MSTKAQYDRFSSESRKLQMHEDSGSRVIGRWRLDDSNLIVDVLPTDTSILGYEGQWLRHVHHSPIRLRLDDGREIKVVRPELFLATKIEAFDGRGRGDYFASKDFKDIVRLVDGRSEIVEEVAEAADELRAFVAKWVAGRVDEPRFQAGVTGALAASGATERATNVAIPRFRSISG